MLNTLTPFQVLRIGIVTKRSVFRTSHNIDEFILQFDFRPFRALGLNIEVVNAVLAGR